MNKPPKPILTILVLVVFVCLSSKNFAQQLYSYDNAGNRIEAKTIVLSSKTAAKSVIKDNKTDTQSYENDDDNLFFNDKLGSINIKIYPNPTKGILRIDIDNLTIHNNKYL